MLVYFTEISKYLNILLIILYIGECIYYEAIEENYLLCEGISIRQRIYTVLTIIISYGTLCMKKGDYDYVFLGLFVLILVLGAMAVSGLIYPRIDKILLNNMLLLLSTGFIIISRLNFDKALKQFFIVLISVSIGIAVPIIIKKWRYVERFRWVFVISGIMPLMLVLVMGTATRGSKISFTIGEITFQPSEFVKIIFVFCMAAMFSLSHNISDVILTGAVAICHVCILVASKDLGGALIYAVCFTFVLFIATKNYLLLCICILGQAGAAVLGYKLFSHVRVRVAAFLDPFKDIAGQGYQITQSIFAINNGGPFGMGLGKGLPDGIPFVESDFIFAAICEEMGIIYGIGIICICFFSFLIMVRTGMNNKKKFYRLLSMGVAVLYIFQVFLTVGGNIKFIPLTGVTLPLVSYGGSSVFISILFFYICQGVIILERDEEYEFYLKKQQAILLSRQREKNEYRRVYNDRDY